MGTVIAGAVIHHIVAGPAKRAFVAGFKTDVVRELIRALSPELDYDPGTGIPREQFVAARLFSTKPDRYQTEDCLTGRIGETQVTMAEVCAEEQRSRTDSEGRTETYYETIFDGVLLVADFHKHFQGTTVVLPDNESGIFSGIGKALQGWFPFGRNDQVRMEDSEFENHFAVFSSDQVEARYILSTSLMRRILDLRRTWGGVALRLSFLDSKIHVAIPCSRNLFEPRLDQPVNDPELIRRVLDEISSCLALVEQLNLNTRIWTREP
jgi:hypothetical protein